MKHPIPGGAFCIRYVMRPRWSMAGAAVVRRSGSHGSAESRFARLVRRHGNIPPGTLMFSEPGSPSCSTANPR